MINNIPVRLKKAIEDNNLVIFAGAGTSLKFNLPTWKQLVIDVITGSGKTEFQNFISLIETGVMSPIQVLEYLKGEHVEIRGKIKSHFNVESTDLGLHKNLIKLSGKIITTNYDNAFEKADESILPTLHSSIFNVSELNKSNANFIFKIHGSYNEPDSCIIFQDDYKKLYGSETASNDKLKTLFTDKVILFIGFGFNDPDLNILFNKLNEIFKNNNKHFIITDKEYQFKSYDFLESIVVNNFSEVDGLIQDYLALKQPTLIEQNRNKVDVENKFLFAPPKVFRIAILSPNPLDLNITEELKHIPKLFDSLDTVIHSGYLNVKTLQSLEDYDYAIIITKGYKGKLYIEDSDLKSQLISIDELLYNIVDDNIVKIVVTNERFSHKSKIPFVLIESFKPVIINKFIYKFFKQAESVFHEEEINVPPTISPRSKFLKGKAIHQSIYGLERELTFGSKVSASVLGRIEEQAAIINRILKLIGSNKLLNIKGSGGIGKTTLVKKICNELYYRGYFKEGASFISCENVKTYEDFEEILIAAFGLANIIDFKDYLINNNAKIDTLIILDNFETVTTLTDQNDYRQSLNLLDFCTDYANLILTSRDAIGVEFEDIYTLTPLITDEALELFLRDYGSVESAAELQILRVDILENLLNNNPLAIKLVTKSRIRSTHINELKEQLEKHFFESISEEFTLIYQSDADLNIERTRSIYQSINYSYSKLNDVEKLAFELLHLFPDGISLSDFKKCFAKSESKNNIGDRELRTLRDKSLIDDDNGILRLQPIIRRFAGYQFSKRPIDIVKKYSTDAYAYNCFILDVLSFIRKKKSLSAALKAHSAHRNNLNKVIDYIEYVQFSEENRKLPQKEYLLNYIYRLDDYIVTEKQCKDFEVKAAELGNYFADLDKANTLLSTMVLSNRYYHKEFDQTLKDMSKILPSEKLESRVFKDESRVENKINKLISSIHSMEGETLKHLNCHIKNNDVSAYLHIDMFYLGIPVKISNANANFYKFEYDLMFDQVNISELEKYIKSLFADENLEIMQCTYLLSKVKAVDNNRVKKLVVTNPYTAGLMHLMLAFNSKEGQEKRNNFNKALAYLKHIKYYYLEALYLFCVYLKEINHQDFLTKYEEGISLTERYKYQFLAFKFSKLKEDRLKPYICDWDYYNIPDLKSYVERFAKHWDAELKNDFLLN